MLRLLLTLCLAFAATASSAQDRPRAILVLDGSGSMWGQIDGVAKITIAQDVVTGLLQTLPAEQQLGLTAYGHRRKGDCADIQTLVEPGAGTRAEIAAAVAGITPRGKTPMTDAVVAAAEALRYTEEKATVILVSDGIETCAPDPCAAARALEETGVDFTAHVIGFDITDPEALRQMQCIADETGGTFRTAANAAELTEALAVVSEPEPEPEPQLVSFIATLGQGGPRITEGLAWDLGRSPDGPWVTQDFASDGVAVEAVPETALFVRVLRAEDGASAERSLVVGAQTDLVALVLPELPMPVGMTFRATLENGAPVTEGLVWTITGPDGPVEEARLDPSFTLDLWPGDYTAEVLRIADEVTVTAGFFVEKLEKTVTLVLPEIARSAVIEAPQTAPAGAMVAVRWRADEAKGDAITLASPDQPAERYVAYRGIAQGNPAELRMPLVPGTYELRYVTQGSPDRILATRPIDVSPITATLDAPATVAAGDTVSIGFDGPSYQSDFIAIAAPGAEPRANESVRNVRAGNPARMVMPLTPGTYELRYVAPGAPDAVVLAAQPIEVVDISATIEAPAEIGAGSVLPIAWDGPDNTNDFVSVAEADMPDGSYLAYAYTRNGSPAQVKMPLDPGTYELRYVANGNPDKVLARRAVQVVAVSATIEAPAEIGAGSVLPIAWDGPDNTNDFVSVAEADMPDGSYLAYAYTRNGSPAQVKMPLDPGTYELRYVANGNPDKVLARRAIRIVAAKVALEADKQAVAGSTLPVEWAGPDNPNDYVAVASPDAPAGRYLSYAYTRNGSPAGILMPVDPGSYELRYVANGNPDKTLAARAVTVTPVTAVIEAAATAPAGGTLDVAWKGPDYRNDYVAISKPGGAKYETYTYTSRGNPASVQVPETPGDYELRYYMNQGDTVLATRPLTVE